MPNFIHLNFDAGINIKSENHDNFIYVLKPDGYQGTINFIGKYLGYDQSLVPKIQ